MCGREEDLYKTSIEGTMLNVCKNCCKYGKVIKPLESPREEAKVQKLIVRKPVLPEKEIVFVLVDDYANKIRNKREQLGMNQEDFAKLLHEKESLVHKLETGHFEPGIDMAKKLEKILKIKIVEQHEEEHEKTAAGKSSGYTIGDMIKFK